MPTNDDRRPGWQARHGGDFDSSNSGDNVVAFRPTRNSSLAYGRTIVFEIRAGDLKQAVMDAYFDHLIDARGVAEVFAEYGLERD
jgi:hypothetical protein